MLEGPQFRGSASQVLSICELDSGEIAILWADSTIAVLEVDTPVIEDSLHRYAHEIPA